MTMATSLGNDQKSGPLPINTPPIASPQEWEAARERLLGLFGGCHRPLAPCYSTMPSLVSVAATLAKMVCSSMPIQKLQWCSAA
jgi:hypothetical protein